VPIAKPQAIALDTLQRLRVALAAATEKTARLWHGLRVILIDGTAPASRTPRKTRALILNPAAKNPAAVSSLKAVGLSAGNRRFARYTPKATSTTTNCAS